MRRHVPGFQLLRTYRHEWLRHDLVAGLVLTALLVPQGMAYAKLAGLPPVTGLYTTVLALATYFVVGPSRVLMLGPDSALGPMIAAAVLPLVGSDGDPAKAVALAGMLALMMGGVCILAGIARLGVIAEFLSKPVRVGYLNGVAVIILVGQLPVLFGFGTDATGLLDEATAFARGLRDGDTVWAALAIGLASLAVIIVCRRFWPRVPGALLAVVGAAIAVRVLDLTEHAVAVVGSTPSGFPSPSLPHVGPGDAATLFVAAAGMAFVMLTDTSTVSRSLAAKRGERVDTNDEILALGAANVGAGLFQGFPVSASASRTIVAESSGARTQVTGLVGAVLIVALLISESDLGRYLPSAVLAAIITAAAFELFDLATLRWLWRVRPSELLLSMTALLGVAIVGVLEGIVVAIVLSLGSFVMRAWRPYDAVLGRVPGRKGYHDVDRHTDAVLIPGLVLFRFDAPLFFANSELFVDRIMRSIAARADPIRWVIVAAEPITDIDTTGAEILGELLDELQANDIELAFAELKGPVKDRLRSYDLYDRIGDGRFFPTLGTAIHAYVDETATPWVDWEEEAAGELDDGPDGTEPRGA
ncbi:MAG: SulP family inorganic anion transporter [Acidimicrobiia bacterium]